MRPKPLTVWEVLIPVFIIFNYMHLKGGRDVFAQNIMFTKKLALDAALEVTKNRTSKSEALVPVEEMTQDLILSTKNGIYSEQIRQKQLKEIDILTDHYSKLLLSSGEDYGTMVINAYKDTNRYKNFLNLLKEAERDVNQAAVDTLGDKADIDTLSRIEATSERLRMEKVYQYFNQPFDDIMLKTEE
jgi:hypothetical protein